MTKCSECDKPLTNLEVRECTDQCFECNISHHIGRLSHHIKEERITFEEVIKKLVYYGDK